MRGIVRVPMRRFYVSRLIRSVKHEVRGGVGRRFLTGVLPVVKWTPSFVFAASVMSFTMLGLSLTRIAEVVPGVCSSECLVVV